MSLAKVTALEMRNSDAMNMMTSHTSQDAKKRKEEKHIAENSIGEDAEFVKENIYNYHI